MRILFPLFFSFIFCVSSVSASECDESKARELARDVFARMSELFGGTVTVPKIISYSTDVELRRSLDLTEDSGISGQYVPLSDELHIACYQDNKPVFTRVLRHEASHYYIRRVFGKKPRWLDEGIAAYMETGSLVEEEFLKHVNKERLKEFRMLLRRGRVPSLAEFFQGEPSLCFSSGEYAVAWGFIFTMLHHANPEIQARRRQIIRSVLNHGDIAETGRFLIREIEAAEGDFTKWEVDWRRRIWSIPVR